MSSNNVIENVNAIENVSPNVEKQKKPTLAGKYSKLLNFGFWFSSMTNSEELKTQLYNQLRLFGSIEEQTELFERFLVEEKDIAKTIRKCIAEHNKPPKPVKEKATKAPRKGKADVHQDKLISQLIADANADPIADKSDEIATQEEAEKESARLAKEESDQLAKKAKETKEAEKESARLAKEEADRLAKEAKELKEAEKAIAKIEKEEAIKLAKKAKEAEKEAKEEAARLAKAAKEQEKTNKAKSVKKTSTAKSVPVDVVPITNEVNKTVPIIGDELVAEVIENTPIANEVVETVPIIGDELVADVIEDTPITNPAPKTPEVAEVSNEQEVAKKSKVPKAAKEPKATKEPKSEKKTKKPSKPVKTDEEEELPEVVDIVTRIIMISGKEYLIDTNDTIYNREPPNDVIGKYNPETYTIDQL
jgi:hypothetical protein